MTIRIGFVEEEIIGGKSTLGEEGIILVYWGTGNSAVEKAFCTLQHTCYIRLAQLHGCVCEGLKGNSSPHKMIQRAFYGES